MAALEHLIITLLGQRVTLALEPALKRAIEDLCAREEISPEELCNNVEKRRGTLSLTAALRVFVASYQKKRVSLAEYKAAIASEGLSSVVRLEPAPGNKNSGERAAPELAKPKKLANKTKKTALRG